MSWKRIQRISVIKGSFDVYNLEVNPNNNYYSNGILVHNCFARQVAHGALGRQGIKYNPRIIKIGNIKHIAESCNKIFNEGVWYPHSYQHYFLLNRGLIENGTMGEPFGRSESELLNTYNFMVIAQNYGLPIYFNSKCNALISSEKHFEAMCNLKKTGVLLDATCCSNNDKLLKKFEPGAPLASERINVMKRLSDNGIDIIASARPILKGVTDYDFEGYIGDLCDSGVKSIHLRTLIITGKQLGMPYWQKYAKKNGMVFKNFSWRYPIEYFLDLFERAKEATKRTNVGITASHTLFFKFGTANKGDYKKMSPQIRKSLFSPGIETILREVYKHRRSSKVLYYDDILKPHVKKNKDFMQHKFLMDDKTSSLIWSSSCTLKVRHKFLLSGETITKRSMWNGWSSPCRENNIRNGYLSSINQIFIVVDKNGNNKLDENGNLIYCYIPEEVRPADAKSTHTRDTDAVSVKELKKIGIW